VATENAVSGQVKREKGKNQSSGTHVVPQNAILFGGGIRLRWRASVDAMQRTSVPAGKDGLVLSARPHPPGIPGTVKIRVANLEALQLGIDSGELVAQEEGLLLLGQRFVNSRGDLRANFSYGQLLFQTVVTCGRHKDGDSVKKGTRN